MKAYVIAAGVLAGYSAASSDAAERRFAYRCTAPLVEPPQPVQPAPLPRGGETRRAPPNLVPSPPPVQILGCVEEDVVLVEASGSRGESGAVRGADTGVAGAVMRFESAAEREEAIRAWLERHGAEIETAGSMRVFVAGRAVVALRPGAGAAAYAIYPEHSQAGDLCLTFVPRGASPSYIPTLNNWCMERLDELDAS